MQNSNYEIALTYAKQTHTMLNEGGVWVADGLFQPFNKMEIKALIKDLEKIGFTVKKSSLGASLTKI